MMKVLHLSSSDIGGGAARAAYRLHKSLQSEGLNSQMRVGRKFSNDPSVSGPASLSQKVIGRASEWATALPFNYLGKSNNELHSNGRSICRIVKEINNHPCDVIHLHWINGGFLSIEAIAAFNKPIVWTMHDMWPFCAGEHYVSDAEDAAWRTGYKPNSPPSNCSPRAWHHNCTIWHRKKNAFRRPIHMVGPSKWMADCARKSALMKDWPVCEIANTLDLEIYKPLNVEFCRRLYNLPLEKPLIMIGALAGGARKGFDLIRDALAASKEQLMECDLVAFGNDLGGLDGLPSDIKVHLIPRLHDDYSLAALYNCATVMIVPSRQENLGQTGTEAQACGIPVIAFNTCGQPSVVENNMTGILIQPFDIHAMGSAIERLTKDSNLRQNISSEARSRAIREWHGRKVVGAYLKVYEEAVLMK